MEDFSTDELEKIFRNARSSDELFDGFQSALKYKINNPDLYKIFLANPALSTDELKMYTEKLSSEFKNTSFDFFMWSAEIFETGDQRKNCIESAVDYYKKANKEKPHSFLPLIKLLNLYNFDFEVGYNRTILDYVTNNLNQVKKRSKIYYRLAGLYSKLNDESSAKKYKILAAKAIKEESTK